MTCAQALSSNSPLSVWLAAYTQLLYAAIASLKKLRNAIEKKSPIIKKNLARCVRQSDDYAVSISILAPFAFREKCWELVENMLIIH